MNIGRLVPALLLMSLTQAQVSIQDKGRLTTFTLPHAGSGASGITGGSDRRPPDRLTNRLWLCLGGSNQIAYLTFR